MINLNNTIKRIRKLILSNPKRGIHLKTIFRAKQNDVDSDDVVRINGWHLKSLIRHQVVEVTNLDNMQSFKAKIAGAGRDYKLRSKDVIILTYNQRAKLGLKSDDRMGNLVINDALSDEELRIKELRYTQIAMVVAVLGLLWSVTA